MRVENYDFAHKSCTLCNVPLLEECDVFEIELWGGEAEVCYKCADAAFDSEDRQLQIRDRR